MRSLLINYLENDDLVKLSSILDGASKNLGHPIYLVSDEAYRAVVYDGAKFHSPTKFYKNSIMIYTYGKTLLTPGQRIGYIALSPRMDDLEELRTILYSSQILSGWAMTSALMQHCLRDLSALRYPCTEQGMFSIPRLEAVLEKVGLGWLAAELDEVQNWSQRLSLGEQQRLAFARILLLKPALLFLDEATSALDEASEAKLYSLLRTAPWRPTMVSVGHRSTLRNFHDQVLDVAAFSPPTEHVVYIPNPFLEPRPAFIAPPTAWHSMNEHGRRQ